MANWTPVLKYWTISGKKVPHYLGHPFKALKQLVPVNKAVIVTDETVFGLHESAFKGWKCIVLPPGEAAKQQATVDHILQQLAQLEADRSTTLIAVGGGVITDMAAYAAATYMRGIPCILVPTTLLAMVDAAIGGKNGVDMGRYKNLIGTIRQSDGIWYDFNFLKTLPDEEWQNGFAEIIKHACIADAAMFRGLAQHDLAFYKKNKEALARLVLRNVSIKNKIVVSDPGEKGARRLLNFGHTIGHAIENILGIPHGHAVSVGMVYAGALSAQIVGFKHTGKLVALLEQYGLPTHAAIDVPVTLQMMRHDKKREGDQLHFVLLSSIGKSGTVAVPLQQLEKMLSDVTDDSV